MHGPAWTNQKDVSKFSGGCYDVVLFVCLLGCLFVCLTVKLLTILAKNT